MASSSQSYTHNKKKKVVLGPWLGSFSDWLGRKPALLLLPAVIINLRALLVLRPGVGSLWYGPCTLASIKVGIDFAT